MIELTTPQLPGLPKGMPAVGVSLGMTSDFALALAQMTPGAAIVAPASGEVAPAVPTIMGGAITTGFAPASRQALAATGNPLPLADVQVAPARSSAPDASQPSSSPSAGDPAPPVVAAKATAKARHQQHFQPRQKPTLETRDSLERTGATGANRWPRSPCRTSWSIRSPPRRPRRFSTTRRRAWWRRTCRSANL